MFNFFKPKEPRIPPLANQNELIKERFADKIKDEDWATVSGTSSNLLVWHEINDNDDLIFTIEDMNTGNSTPRVLSKEEDLEEILSNISIPDSMERKIKEELEKKQ